VLTRPFLKEINENDKMKNLISIAIILSFASAFGQKPFREIIETDSSKIEIIRNSVYRVYEETYKKNDSVWYNVTYIDDTTKLNTEGWKQKSGKQLGTWREYNRKGDLLYTRNHDKHTCVVNPKLYPYHQTLEKMKIIANSLIIDAYGKEFMDKHIVFEFDCYAYNKKRIKIGKDSIWTKDYLGSWTEPMKSKPNTFLLRYEVRLNPTDKNSIELGVCFDDKGNYVASSDDTWNNYGFELVKPGHKEFVLDKTKAIAIAKQNGLVESDSSKIDEFLFWENFKKQQYYNGQFRYYITELIGQENYQISKERQGIKYKYMGYIFNPWTGEFVEKKKMKSIREWENGNGLSTELQLNNE